LTILNSELTLTGSETRHAIAPCALLCRRFCERQQIVFCGRKKLPFAGYSVVKELELATCMRPLDDDRNFLFYDPRASISSGGASRTGELQPCRFPHRALASTASCPTERRGRAFGPCRSRMPEACAN
jgi:hypothetical protein